MSAIYVPFISVYGENMIRQLIDDYERNPAHMRTYIADLNIPQPLVAEYNRIAKEDAVAGYIARYN